MLNKKDSEVYLGWLLTQSLFALGWPDHMWACFANIQGITMSNYLQMELLL